MNPRRSVDEQPANYFRSHRVSSVNGRFFFSTREGTLEGPFRSQPDAERGIVDYIGRMIMAERLLRHSSEHIDNLCRTSGTRAKPAT
jgi:hypothetical protein